MVHGKSFISNINFLLLEHWPKFNTDEYVNFSGSQNMCVK